MKILYEPQCSMRSYDGNGWLLSSDAQINKMLAYVRALPEDWEWIWTVPATRGMKPLEAQLDLPSNVKPMYRPWPSNVLLHRFHFDMMDSIDCLNDLKLDSEVPDVMLCEVPEHVRGWTAAMKEADVSFPIIAMYEHVDIYEETKRPDLPFFLRQLEGYTAADLCAFPLAGMQDSWKQATMKLGVESQVDWSKSRIWNALTTLDPSGVCNKTSKPTIFFAGRCSDEPRTKWKRFIEACDMLKQTGLDFRVWFANPNEAQDWSRLAKCPGFEQHPYGNRTLERREYLDLLSMADVVPVLYPQSHIYSIGFMEAIAHDCLVVTDHPPSRASYGETIGIQVDCMLSTEIAGGLHAALRQVARGDKGKLKQLLGDQKKWASKHRSVERNIDKIKNDIEELVQ